MEQNNLVAHQSNAKTRDILREMWQDVYERGGDLSYRIISGSMSPVIEVDDVVRVSQAEPSRVRIGDIVAFQIGQNVVVHRVIGKRRSGHRLCFRQMGDVCRSSGRFPAENLIGKVTVIQKKGHEIYLNSPRQVIKNRITGWRLRFFDTMRCRMRRAANSSTRKALRLIWGLCRSDSSGISGRKQ